MMTKVQFEEHLNDAVAFWNLQSVEGVSELLGKDVAKMVGFDQRNPHHCYDLFKHSLYTVEGLPNTASVLLRVAAFFHDIGKPRVMQQKQGRLVFYGHVQKSVEIARPLLETLNYSEIEIEEICFYIEHHDDFIPWVLPEEEYDRKNRYLVEISVNNVKKHINKVAEKMKDNWFVPEPKHWACLLQLCYADASAQADVVVQGGKVIDTKNHKLRKIEALLQCLKELYGIAALRETK